MNDHIKQLLLIEEQCFTYDRLSERSFRYHIKKDNLIALPNDIGYIILTTYKKTLRIYSIAVLPQHQGKGLSKRLIKFAIYKAKQGNRDLTLECREELRDYYTKLGFEEYGRIGQYYEDNAPCIRFRMPLRATEKPAGAFK